MLPPHSLFRTEMQQFYIFRSFAYTFLISRFPSLCVSNHRPHQISGLEKKIFSFLPEKYILHFNLKFWYPCSRKLNNQLIINFLIVHTKFVYCVTLVFTHIFSSQICILLLVYFFSLSAPCRITNLAFIIVISFYLLHSVTRFLSLSSKLFSIGLGQESMKNSL